jgi:hypothetical protein
MGWGDVFIHQYHQCYNSWQHYQHR